MCTAVPMYTRVLQYTLYIIKYHMHTHHTFPRVKACTTELSARGGVCGGKGRGTIIN